MQSQQSCSQVKSPGENRIDEEIQAIRSLQHIKEISRNSENIYTITYHPSGTNSAYRQRTYTLQLTLPPTYPNDPPSIRFLDSVYHLNIGLRSGEVRMPVLEDDWSPFLSLNSVIESLDKILEQPDEHYALDDQTLNLYHQDKQSYTKKVEENVTQLDIIICESATRRGSPINSQSPIKKFNQTHKIYSNKPGKENPEFLVRNLRESMQFIDEGTIQNHQDQQKQDEAVIKKTQSGKNIKRTKQTKQQMVVERSGAFQLKLYGANRNQSRKKLRSDGSSQLESENMALQKINETIRVFIDELNQLEAQIENVKNQGIKVLLRERHDSQLEMLRELMSLSEDMKRKIVGKLRDEVSNI